MATSHGRVTRAAARLRIATDTKRGLTTPSWIKRIAELEEDPDTNHFTRALAALDRTLEEVIPDDG
jgi:hypothetical protein